MFSAGKQDVSTNTGFTISAALQSSPNTRFDGESSSEIVRRHGPPALVVARGTLDAMRGH